MHRLLIALSGLCLWTASSHACQSGHENTFDAVAPTATDIVAVQIESLSFTPGPFGEHNVRGKIRVLKHYRGAERFTELRYTNSSCAGMRIDIGGIYLIAVNASGPSIELDSFKAPILQLSGTYPIDLEHILGVNDTVRRLEAALQDDGGFAIATIAAREGLVRGMCPPPVPPPESFNDAVKQ